MAKRRNCKHQGFAHSKDGYKNVHIMLTTRYEKCIMMETLTIDRGG